MVSWMKSSCPSHLNQLESIVIEQNMENVVF